MFPALVTAEELYTINEVEDRSQLTTYVLCRSRTVISAINFNVHRREYTYVCVCAYVLVHSVVCRTTGP